jgi:amidohydrolase
MSQPFDPTTAIRQAVAAVEPELIALRRDLHAHPELAFQEERTAGVVARELARASIPHRTKVGGTGVVGLITGGRPGPVLALRADMDALPIEEKTGVPWASTVPGCMHACGHDLHTATLIGVARVLTGLAPRLAGSVKLIFQPAEETIRGMQRMLEEGVLEDPEVDLAVGFHNGPDLPVGRFSYTPGPAMAAADSFEVVVHGASGHAAHPHAAVDPVVAAAHLITELQTIVSREVDPMQPAVVTVGAIHGGEAVNIIPDSVTFRGTVRSLHREARDGAEAALRRLAAGAETGLRVRCAVTYNRGVPALVNDDAVCQRTVAAVRHQLGEVIAPVGAVMGSEDLALLFERVPGCHLRVGSGAPGRHDTLHNSGYLPDESCIGFGVQALCRVALELLG